MHNVRRIYLEDNDVLLIHHKEQKAIESLCVRVVKTRTLSSSPYVYVDERPGSTLILNGEGVSEERK